MALKEIAQKLNNENYGRFMSYAAKFRSSGKKIEAKKVHEKAQLLNKYFYSATHTDNIDLILYYDQQMSFIISETNTFIKEV